MTETILDFGTPVGVVTDNGMISGIVVGKANNSITEPYIIKCTDGRLPNDVYKYDTFVAPLYNITY